MISDLYSADPPDSDMLDKTLSSIKAAREKISFHSTKDEKEVLLYCIDTLFEILDESDKKKIFDFSGAIQNIPEIYMQKRNLYSFRKELKHFQNKYGKHYFPFIDKVKPSFTKKAPKNKWEYFFPESDEDFKSLHPVGYNILVAVGITALMLPQVLYLIFEISINHAPNEWPLILGYIGAFAVGVGLFNIVAAWIHQYLGHLLTFICIIGGGAFIFLSHILLYR